MDVASMGKKSKKHGNRQSANDLFQYAQRAMEKQDFKEALKNAKVCFRQDPSHEHRQILERSWLGRGLQLARAGLQPEGRAAAQELLAMGVLEPDVQQGLPELLLAVGLYDHAVTAGKLPRDGQEAPPAVLARAADRAVADPASAPASLSGTGEGAAMVRAALDALSAGDEGASLAALGEVPRNSPFADWKLFVRGLAAYYRRDDEAMRANWDRLAPDRFAARLAAPLRRLADPAAAVGDPASAAGNQEECRQAVRVLENNLLGGPVVWYLESLQKSLREGRWREAVFGVRRWKKDFQSALPGLARRLDRLFYDMAVRKTNRRWLQELTTAIDPPRWDPRWNRAWAMISEEEDDDLETAEAFWLAYVEDLASLPDLKPGERTLAQAMICERLGLRWAEEADAEDDYDDCDYEEERESSAEGEDDDPGRDWTRLSRAKTTEYLNKAIDLAPGLSTAYHALASNYVQWKQEDAAAEIHRRLLARVPDDIDAIVSLFHYHRQRGEALAARDYAVQARRLKPASEEMLNVVVAGHFLAARALALQGRWDEARAELAAAEAAGPASGGSAYDRTVRRAMIEFKAGQAEAGRRLVDQALSESDPADVYLALAIEAVRYELPFELEGLPLQFHDRWLSSLKKRRSRAAGAMSRRMWAFMEETGRFSEELAFLNDYLERVVKYVSGCSRIRWQADDLLNVCRFLDRILDDPEFREVRRPLVKFLDIGRKKFPQDAEFHVARGQLEMRRGPTCCNRRLARECFAMAIETAKTSSSPRAKEIRQIAGQRLRLLGRAGEGLPPGRSSQAFDDFAGVPPEFLQGRGPREEIIEMIKRMSASMGIDPQEAIEEIMGELPFAATKER
jgi:tetratricopeptide (TPR) repeat protein